MWSLLWLPVFFLTTLVYVELDNEESPVVTVKKSVSSFFAIEDHLVIKDSQSVAVTGLQIRSFTVDYSRGTFLKDGQPFSFIGGDIHYFRVPRPYWRDRLSKMRAAGVDTLTTYINWALHELNPGQYDFSGQYDFIEFLRIAEELDFNIILRPSPYISSELDLGGYPSWLLTKVPNIQLRTRDPLHKYYVKRWLDVLMPKVVPLLYGNGGNIIMVQVENELGFSEEFDKQYLKWLYDLMLSYVKDAAVLFTADQPNYIGRGFLPGVLETINFGPSVSPMEKCSLLREYQPRGPCVVIEFYMGYFTTWGQDWARVRTQSIVSNIETFLQNNVSFSMYMFHGGTNFHFTAGSTNIDEFFITSYDFDAPISEAGDLTPKYMAIRDTIKKYRKVGDLPAPSPKGNYGAVHLRPVCSLFDCPIGTEYSSFKWPLTFEELGQTRGFMSYSTTLNRTSSGPSLLRATVRDRTTVLLDGVQVGVLEAGGGEVVLPDAGRSLRLFVENMGRRTVIINTNRKRGLLSNATVDGELVSNWTITGYPLYPEDIAKLNDMAFDEENISFPAVFRGSFTLREGETPLDTFLSMDDWGKGVAIINNIGLGKYWEIGPQEALYVPAPFLRAYPAPNIVTIMELYKTHPNKTITFLQKPIIEGNFTYKYD